jgi:GTPase SAR1 family protein
VTQDFQKPFDAPAVLIVGQQTSGKSALIEALMGFQFNQVLSSFRHSDLVILFIS